MGTKERVEILNKSNCVTNELLKRISNLEYEVERLNNIINELEKWLKYEWYEMGEDIGLDEVLNKIEELKGEDKE